VRVAFRVEPATPPAVHLAETRRALAARAPLLRVYALDARVLSLGRWHLVPAGAAGVVLQRRHTGGRVVPHGTGFAGVSLVLPHRSALAGDDPLALAPEQVMNRCVRGILRGLEALGVAPFYPGRDFVTVDRRVFGLVSFETDGAGTLLFEAILGLDDDFGALPALLEAADPAGVVPAVFIARDDATSLARLGAPVPVAALADAIGRGYAETSGFELVAAPAIAAAVADEDAAAWVASRRARPGLARRAAARVQLGTLEVRLACADGRITDALVIGDVVADSPGMAALEAALRGCPAAPDAVRRVVDGVFGGTEHFVLGIGPLATLVDAIVQAIG